MFLKVCGPPWDASGARVTRGKRGGGGLIFGRRNQCSATGGGGGGVARDRNPPRTYDRRGGGGVKVEYRQPVTSAGTQEKVGPLRALGGTINKPRYCVQVFILLVCLFCVLFWVYVCFFSEFIFMI